MSYRAKGLGMDRELERKIEEKYSEDDEHEVVQWILEVLSMTPVNGDIKYPEGEGSKSFQKWLADGTILCDLMNKLEGRTVCKYKDSSNVKMAALKTMTERDNVSKFLTAAENYGVKKESLFQTVCLCESTNLPQVITTLFDLGSASQNKGFNGPIIGVRKSNKNVRQFDEQTLKEGRNVIGLQMGTNQVASQQGMTPYGLGRQLTQNTPPSKNGFR